MHKHRTILIAVLAVLTSLVHLYAPIFGIWTGLRPVSVATFGALVFLLYPLKVGNRPMGRGVTTVIDYILAALSLAIGVYVGLDYGEFQGRAGVPTELDLVVGCVLIVLVLEGTRRCLGMPLVILSGLAMVYALYGRQMPLVIAHGGSDIERLINQLFVLPSGVYGLPVGVTATYIAIFIMFGALLEKSGAAALFMEWSRRGFGHFTAGPAKMAVVSSAMMGSMSGSSVANVVTTGAFTIPLMKQLGLKPKTAAAIEACASTGGMILPPVMGAAAFIVAETLGVGYGTVVQAALLPAALYFGAIYLVVHLEGRKHDLTGLPPEGARPARVLLRESWWILLPIVLLFVMLIQQYSAMRAASVSLGVLALLVIMKKGLRAGFLCVYESLRDSAQITVPIALACACAGIIVGVVNMTGLALRFTSVVLSLAGDSSLLALIFTMIITVILGMGLPVTAAYITTAALAVPVLIELGVGDLPAHMFVLYFAAFSAITPPVALATFAAAGIARTNMWATALEGVRIGMVAYIIPFFFVYSPALLIVGSDASKVALALLTAPVGVAAVACGLVGYAHRPLGPVPRCLILAAGVLLIHQSLVTDAVALALAAIGFGVEAFSAQRAGSIDPDKKPTL